MDRLKSKKLLSRIIRLKIRKCKLNINLVLKREPTKSFSKYYGIQKDFSLEYKNCVSFY